MQLINDRYKIITKLDNNRLVSTYVVSDIYNEGANIKLNVLNFEYIPKEIITFYENEFRNLANIESSKIIRVFDFGKIYYIDNKSVQNNQYYFTNEYFEECIEIEEYISTLNHEKQILDFISELCEGLNYLHFRGIKYKELNLNNIVIVKCENKYSLKLIDLATVALSNLNYWQDVNTWLKHKAPEIHMGVEPSVQSDIYSMGYIINSVIQLCSNVNKEFNSNIKSLINKMTSDEANLRYNSVMDIINDINEKFNKEYKYIDSSEIDKLTFNTSIVGREYEIDLIMSKFNNTIKYHEDSSVFAIHGESGIGKTRLLKEIQYKMELKSNNVFACYSLQNKKSDKLIYEMIKMIMKQCDPEVMDKYGEELVKVIPEIGYNGKIVPSQALSGEKEKFRLINSIYSFLSEFVKNKPIVFIVDNLNFADSFTIEVIEYIYFKEKTSNNIMFVVAYNDMDIKHNIKAMEFIEKTKEYYNFKEILLRGVGQEDTTLIIKNILNVSNPIVKFGKKIYLKSYGNPLFIEEIIKNLYVEKIIYVSERGIWNCDYREEEYNNLPVPTNIEQAIYNQVSGLSKMAYDILSIISIFNVGISYDNMQCYFENECYIQDSLKRLEESGYICKKIEDRGIVYDFYNRILKNYVYNKIEENTKREYHEKAVELLEKNPSNNMEEELIYHIERSNNKYRIVKYCRENSEKLLGLRNKVGAVKSLIKALSIFDVNSFHKDKVDLLIEIADIYANGISLSKATIYYEEAFDILKCIKDIELQIKVLNKMCLNYINKLEIEKAEQAAEICMNLLDKRYNEEDYLNSCIVRIELLIFNLKYDKAIEVGNECIHLCEKKYEHKKGKVYNVIGKAYRELNCIDKAFDNFKISKIWSKKINDIEGIAIATNNMGAIYIDSDVDSAIECFDIVKRLSEDNDLKMLEILALVNLGTGTFAKLQYEKAQEYFEIALEKSEKIEYESIIFYCYSFLSSIALRLKQYDKAYKYFIINEKKYLDNNEQDIENLRTFAKNSADLFFEFGDFNRAEEYTNEGINYFNNMDSKLIDSFKIMNYCISIFKDKSKINVDKNIEHIIYLLNDNINVLDRISMIYDLCSHLIIIGDLKNSLKLYDSLAMISAKIKCSRIEGIKLYIESMLMYEEKNEDNKIKKLIYSFNIAKEENCGSLLWKVCSEMGDYYFLNKNYFNSVNYYVEALEIVKKLTYSLPVEFRVNYVNSYKMLTPKYRISIMKNNEDYFNILDIDKVDYNNIYTNEHLDMAFKYENFKNILKNKYFLESARKIYSISNNLELDSLNDLVNNLYSDPIKNIELILNYVKVITLSTSAFVLIEKKDGNIDLVCANKKNYNKNISKILIDKVKYTKDEILLTDLKEDEHSFLSKDTKAIMFIPIIMNNEIKSCNINDKKCLYDSKKVLGYLQIESERTLNNFNTESMEQCRSITKLIGTMLENKKLSEISSIDKLTGVFTRKHLDAKLEENLDRASEIKSNCALIMLDLDYFKEVNDKFGHQTGDDVLKNTCNIVLDSIRKEDICCRYGGEEFMIILPDINTDEAMEVAERIRVNVEKAKLLREKREITVSIGVAIYPEHGLWKHELFEKVDKALYVAKQNGRNQCQLWNDKFDSKIKLTNKLTGIVNGNAVEDYRRVAVMLEIIDLIKNEESSEEKIYKLLGRVIEAMEVQYGMVFLVEDNKIQNSYQREIFKSGWQKYRVYNENIIRDTIEKKQGEFVVDWDGIVNYDIITGIPEWHSVLVTPMIKNGNVKGVLYLTVSNTKKEFNYDDFNFINNVAKIGTALL